MSQTAFNYQSHLFYIDPSANKYLPLWFLELATREQAEKVLSRSVGNVLMRSHPSFESTGKYVITYRKETDSFRHYLLLNTPDGFQLDIDHKNNRPVNCLSKAMDLFVKLVGRTAQPIDSGSSSEYVNTHVLCATTENTKKGTNINKNVSRNPGFSTGSLQTSHNYINTPQASAMGQLNSSVPSIPETFGSFQPIHNYLNMPQISVASSSSKFCPEQHNTKEPRSYVNMQQLSPTEEDTYMYAERPGFRSRPVTEDDFPPNFAPPPPERN